MGAAPAPKLRVDLTLRGAILGGGDVGQPAVAVAGEVPASRDGLIRSHKRMYRSW